MSRAALVGCFLGMTSYAGAQAGLDRCNDILKQDLFNKVHSSSQASVSERAAYAEYVYSLSESDAYDEYLRAYESSKKEGNSGKLEGGYGWGFIDGDAEFSHSYDRKLSESEFSTKFNKSKAVHQKNASSSSAKDASLVSVYMSSVRDATSVKAWEHCMATRYPDPGLFAYGYRDGSGNPYIIVMWQPGTFAAANPVISVKFSVTEPGMTIEGGVGSVNIASGSGAAFPVRFESPNDRKAQFDGFAVLVNGELKSGGQLVQSFRSEAVVPRNVGPIPCSLIFTSNRPFEIGILDSVKGEMNWESGLGFMMLARPEERQSSRGRAAGRGRGGAPPEFVRSIRGKQLQRQADGGRGKWACTTQYHRIGVRAVGPGLAGKHDDRCLHGTRCCRCAPAHACYQHGYFDQTAMSEVTNHHEVGHASPVHTGGSWSTASPIQARHQSVSMLRALPPTRAVR